MNNERVTPAAHGIDRTKNANRGTQLMFPHDIGHHAMILNFKKYSYGGSAHVNQVSSDSIILPLPKNLQDNLNIKVGADELGITGAIAGSALNASSEVLSDTSQSAAQIRSMFRKTVDGAAEEAESTNSMLDFLDKSVDGALFAARAGLGAIAPDVAKGLGAGRGTAINPYATLVFSGVDLKVHTFEWLLSPDTPKEAETLKNIIRIIQNHITPEMQGVVGDDVNPTGLGRGLLRYPSMVDAFFHGINTDFFYKLKTCMVSQFNVDYTPNGIALNKGGKPSAVRINMIMTEAAIHTKADYSEKTAPSTGSSKEKGANDSSTNDTNVDATGGQLP